MTDDQQPAIRRRAAGAEAAKFTSCSCRLADKQRNKSQSDDASGAILLNTNIILLLLFYSTSPLLIPILQHVCWPVFTVAFITIMKSSARVFLPTQIKIILLQARAGNRVLDCSQGRIALIIQAAIFQMKSSKEMPHMAVIPLWRQNGIDAHERWHEG